MHALTLVSLVGLAAAQQSQYLNFTLDKSQVDPVELSSWCTGERNTCQALCPGRPDENSCDIETLTYECQCSNGTEPGLRYYDQSLYSFVCREAFGQCNDLNAGDKAELDKCVTDIKDECGTLTIDVEEAEKTDSPDPDSTEETDPTTTDDSDDSSETDEPGAAMAMLPAMGTLVVAAIAAGTALI